MTPKSRLLSLLPYLLSFLLFSSTLYFCCQPFPKRQRLRSLLSLDETNEICFDDADWHIGNYYSTGQKVSFDRTIYTDNARPLINMAIGKGSNSYNRGEYVERLGAYFFFVACAGISLIVWVFVWICWANQCCCCDFLHAKQYRNLAFWVAIIFYFGMIACCISGFVYLYRFNIDLNGATCAFEKVYYDMKEGQMKKDYPKWEGLESISWKIKNLSGFINNVKKFTKEKAFYPPSEDWGYDDEYQLIGSDTYIRTIKKLIDDSNSIKIRYNHNNTIETENYTIDENGDKIMDIPFFEKYIEKENLTNSKTAFGKILLDIRSKIYPYLSKLQIIQEKINELDLNGDSYINKLNEVSTKINSVNEDWKSFRPFILDKWDYYRHVTYAFFYIVLLIYFIIVLGLSLSGIGFLITYVCIKEQTLIRKILVIIWNCVKFFSFSYFMYGAAFGMLSLAFKDCIGFINYAFSEENLNSENPMIIPNKTSIPVLQYCLLGKKTDLIKMYELDTLLIESLENLYTEFNKLLNYNTDNLKTYLSAQEGNKLINQYKSLEKLNPDNDENHLLNTIVKKINGILRECGKNNENWTVSECPTNQFSCDRNFDTNANKGYYSTSLCNKNPCCVELAKINRNCNFSQYNQNIYSDCQKIKNDETFFNYIYFIQDLNDMHNSILDSIQNNQNSIVTAVFQMCEDLLSSIQSISGNFKEDLDKFTEDAITYGGIFSFMDCAFLRNDINIIFELFTSLSSRSRSLCGICCSMAFFGCVTVYFSLFCMYHYDKSRFKDLKKDKIGSFGGSSDDHYYKKKSKVPLIDNQYKKNKDKEIELTSRISEDNDSKNDTSRSKRK